MSPVTACLHEGYLDSQSCIHSQPLSRSVLESAPVQDREENVQDREENVQDREEENVQDREENVQDREEENVQDRDENN